MKIIKKTVFRKREGQVASFVKLFPLDNPKISSDYFVYFEFPEALCSIVFFRTKEPISLLLNLLPTGNHHY